MYTIKIIKIGTLLSLLTLLINCGGGGSSSSGSTVSSFSKEARSHQVSPVGFREQSGRQGSGKMQLKTSEKVEGPISCEISGIYYYEAEVTDTGGTIVRYLNEKCQARDTETGKIIEENGGHGLSRRGASLWLWL